MILDKLYEVYTNLDEAFKKSGEKYPVAFLKNFLKVTETGDGLVAIRAMIAKDFVESDENIRRKQELLDALSRTIDKLRGMDDCADIGSITDFVWGISDGTEIEEQTVTLDEFSMIKDTRVSDKTVNDFVKNGEGSGVYTLTKGGKLKVYDIPSRVDYGGVIKFTSLGEGLAYYNDQLLSGTEPTEFQNKVMIAVMYLLENQIFDNEVPFSIQSSAKMKKCKVSPGSIPMSGTVKMLDTRRLPERIVYKEAEANFRYQIYSDGFVIAV